jgi:hypothetical protein
MPRVRYSHAPPSPGRRQCKELSLARGNNHRQLLVRSDRPASVQRLLIVPLGGLASQQSIQFFVTEIGQRPDDTLVQRLDRLTVTSIKQRGRS